MAALAAAAGTDEELRALMEQRRAKRMLSNRESARRLRMRKQRHLDDLTAQAAHLRRENAHVATALGVTTQDLVVVDAENAVLRTQAAELAARLGSLNDILACMNTNAGRARPGARKAAGKGCARATGGEGRARLVRVRPSVAGWAGKAIEKEGKGMDKNIEMIEERKGRWRERKEIEKK